MTGTKSWVCLALLFAISNSAWSQPFPAKPVRFILGPSSEVLPRIIAQRLSTMWGYQVLVDARPGGGGTVAADTVAKAPPDGHTWLLSTATFTVSASLLANPPFDLTRDFQAVTLLASAPFYLTPLDLINKLNADLRQALQAPEVQERLTAASLDIHGNTRAEFEAFVNKDRARWAKVVKDAGITPE